MAVRIFGVCRKLINANLMHGVRCNKNVLRKIGFSSALSDAAQVFMPSLSPTMQRGTIVKWYKQEGDSVQPGDLLCDIQTDKAVVGYETEEEGILAKILMPDNTPDVAIGDLIALIVEPGADWKTVSIPAAAAAPSATVTPAADSDTSVPPTPVSHHLSSSDHYGPAVKNLLAMYNIIASSVSASGPHSLLLKGDVLNYVKAKNLQPVTQTVDLPPKLSPAMPTPSPPLPPQPPVSAVKHAAAPAPLTGDFTDVELSNMRSVIASRLTLSKTTIPHSYVTVDCNINHLLNVRRSLLNEGIKVGVNDFIIKAAAIALQSVPDVNVVWSGDTAQRLDNIDISVAVATDNGLITPIVKNAIGLGIQEISASVKDLASRARDGKLKLDEFQGGTFTISNLGMFGISSFSAVINPPQTCILAVGAARPVLSPADHPGDVTTATMVSMTTASDARVIDDKLAAEFLDTVRAVLENPSLMLSHCRPAVKSYDVQKLFAK